MQLDNLSKHGILTGSLIIIFLTVMTILAANKIHEINYLSEMFRDFNEFDENPPPTLDVPVGVIVISSVMIVVTGLMMYGILKKRRLFLAPWLILFILSVLSEIIFFIHQLVRYFSLELLLYMFCILGIELLIFSPIAFIFYDIGRRQRDVQQILQTDVQQDIETNSAFLKNCN